MPLHSKETHPLRPGGSADRLVTVKLTVRNAVRQHIAFSGNLALLVRRHSWTVSKNHRRRQAAWLAIKGDAGGNDDGLVPRPKEWDQISGPGRQR
jgi:hypothetical protein